MRINYDAIFNELRVAIAISDTRRKSGVLDGYSLVQSLRNDRTIGFHIPRQMGKTEWMARQHVLGNALSIVANRAIGEHFEKLAAENARELFEGDGHYHTTGTALATDVIGEIMTRSNKGSKHVFNPKKWYPADAPNLVLIDDQGLIASRIGLSKLYEWLALFDNPHMVVCFVGGA